ncbi:tryptophan-rich sensory protein [Rarobacter faecitabidus]|uniref:TspO/MBR related protein n=1 Tax=Rarobacter faecitabidus TaxID=13243 RepID=A0A542ZTR4_RARFA|nr:TspO/MBR family protein [Rarobacter faecitabidus]TQL63744.1 TspO/MBR related protein [Rarobacter faecitabidus]
MAKNWVRVWAVGTVAAAAAIGGYGSRNAAEVYARLDKPRWAPPAAAFAPAWTALYAANAVVGWRTVTSTQRLLHTGQLVLNAAWTPLFFDARKRTAALGTIIALDAVVAAEIAALRRTDKVAAGLLVPYLGWLAYATALTASVSDPGEVR